MEVQSPPKWLSEIREYWSHMTSRLTEENGGPAPKSAGSLVSGASELPSRRSRAELPSLHALTEEVE